MNTIDTNPFVHIIHDNISLSNTIINKTNELANTFHNAKDVRTLCPVSYTHLTLPKTPYV